MQGEKHIPFSKLSVVIPCYNEERTIHRILDKISSVRMKNGIQIEFVLVDDCSTDNSLAAIREYFSKNPQPAIYR